VVGGAPAFGIARRRELGGTGPANPATILNGEVLGYLDPLMMLPAIGMLVLLHEGWPALAGAAFAIAL
jgi:hypothetical protein